MDTALVRMVRTRGRGAAVARRQAAEGKANAEEARRLSSEQTHDKGEEAARKANGEEATRRFNSWSAHLFKSVDAAAADFVAGVLGAARTLPRGARRDAESWWNEACSGQMQGEVLYLAVSQGRRVNAE